MTDDDAAGRRGTARSSPSGRHSLPTTTALPATSVVPLVALLTLVALVAAACGASPTSGTASSRPPTTTTAAPTTTTVAPTTTTDPGLLPQTPAEPPVDRSLQSTLTPLWSAIVSGAQPAPRDVFFPQSAYLQMKTGVLPDPASDYADRLIAFYNLDLAAYHQALGAGAATAKLVAVDADAADAAWIGPGSCENRIGYWHLPGVRLVYQEGGTVQSFAVASLISWRGVWYVVHLGPNPRPSNVGTVDQPSPGSGTPGPAGGC
jgi:hypothetical protein